MSKLKKYSNTQQENKTEDTSSGAKGVKIAAIVTAAVLVFVIVLAIVETAISGTVKIVNDTGYDLENIGVYFDNSIMSDSEDYGLFIEKYISDEITSVSVDAGETYKAKFDTLPLENTYAGMVTEFKFADNEAIEYNTGYFVSNFNGRIVIKFYEEDDKVYMSVKASEGIFGSTTNTECEAVYNITSSVKGE